MAVLDGLAGRVVLLQGWTVESAAADAADTTILHLCRHFAEMGQRRGAERLTLTAVRIVLATGVRYNAQSDPLLAYYPLFTNGARGRRHGCYH